MAEGFEEGVLLDQRAEVLYLCTIRRDDAHVDLLVEHASLADLHKIAAQHVEGEFCLALVHPPETVADKLLATFSRLALYGYPVYWDVIVENATVAHLWCTHHLAVVEPVGGEAHDLLVHPVLHLQQRHHCGLPLYDAFHESLA